MNCIFTWEFIIDSIASNNYEIMVVFDFKSSHIWVSDDYVYISVIFSYFCLNITDGSGYWKPSWKDSMRSINNLFTCFSKSRISLNYLRILVNPSSVIYNSFHLYLFGGFVICREQEQFFTSICRHYGSTISSVCAVAHVVNDQNDYSTTSWPINISGFLLLTLSKFKE